MRDQPMANVMIQYHAPRFPKNNVQHIAMMVLFVVWPEGNDGPERLRSCSSE
jgi:hypothetical protein